MVRAVKRTVTIQAGGRIEVTSTELPEGQQAEVIVLVSEHARAKSYASLFGCGKGAFASPDETDAFLRKERDAWNR